MQSFRIPVKDRTRGTIIGHCRRAPYGNGLTLVTPPRLSSARRSFDQGDCAVIDKGLMSVRLDYDTHEGCYWTDSYDCLRSDQVDPA